MYQHYKREFDSNSPKEMNIIDLLKSTISKDGESADLTPDDIEELLRSDPMLDDPAVRTSIVSYPTRPLYREIGAVLQTWADHGRCPISDLPSYELLDERDYVEKRNIMFEKISRLLEGMKNSSDSSTVEDKEVDLCQIIKILGKRGLLDLLGIRKTIGSKENWPPPRKVLENTFNMKHKPNTASLLTVGARALTKHAHRDQSSTWWGVCTGSEAAKNEHAEGVLKRILNNVTWLNIHSLPHDVFVIEARQENGYGMRWSADGAQFRGFLEPQMVDGHEVGWRH